MVLAIMYNAMPYRPSRPSIPSRIYNEQKMQRGWVGVIHIDGIACPQGQNSPFPHSLPEDGYDLDVLERFWRLTATVKLVLPHDCWLNLYQVIILINGACVMLFMEVV